MDKNMKLIFFDIDGTLLPLGSDSIPESAGEAIRQARANGHICIVNTGRTKAMVGEELSSQAEFDGYLYGCGTMAYYHDEMLFHNTFTLEQSKQIMEGLKRHRIDAILEGSQDDYVQHYDRMYTDFFRNYVSQFRTFHFDSYDVALGKYDKLYAHVNRPEDIKGFYEEFCEELDFIDRERGFYEILPKGCSKASAIRHMAKLLQIPMEDTVAIGDSNNDLSMLKCVGTSIAMGNSTQNILDMADYITTDVDKDGIWNALEWLGVIACK